MRITLEQHLQEELAEGGSDDEFVVRQLHKQIAAKRTGKSLWELYVTDSVSPKLKLSEYSNSIWNEYGTYGSEYLSESPWNEFFSSAPKLFDTVGNYYGRFSINMYAGFDLSENLKRLYDAANGNLAVVRKGLFD